MPSKRTSNDIYFVLPTQYNVQPNRIAKEPPPEPWPLPDFTPLNIHDFNDHGKPNLPPDLNLHDPFALFSQFFTDDIMDRLVEWTNTYAGLHPAKEDEGHPEHPRKWTRTCKEELYAYLAVLIHMGISAEPCIEDYWGDLESHGSKHIVSKYIGLCRFQQLDRYFRCTTPWPKGDPTPRTTFDRVAELAEHLRLTCRKLYNPGTHLAVDETIERFTGRASEIVNIPTKPTPEGFKIWVLANKGYILNQLWHARGDKGGPVDLDETFTKEEGFSKTQAVVLDLLTQRDAESNEPLYLPGKHIVWLDNLFTSVKLLTRLRELGIRGAGTVRTTRTKREEQGDIEGDVLAVSVGRKKKVPTEQIDQRLVNLKLTHSAQLQWGTLYGATLKDGQVMEFAWKDANVVLFMSTVDDGKKCSF